MVVVTCSQGPPYVVYDHGTPAEEDFNRNGARPSGVARGA